MVPEAAVVAVESAPAMAAAMSPRVCRCGYGRQERPREQHGAKHGKPNATVSTWTVQPAVARCARLPGRYRRVASHPRSPSR